MRHLWIVSCYSHSPVNYIEDHTRFLVLFIYFMLSWFVKLVTISPWFFLTKHSSKRCKEKIKLFQFCKNRCKNREQVLNYCVLITAGQISTATSMSLSKYSAERDYRYMQRLHNLHINQLNSQSIKRHKSIGILASLAYCSLNYLDFFCNGASILSDIRDWARIYSFLCIIKQLQSELITSDQPTEGNEATKGAS